MIDFYLGVHRDGPSILVKEEDLKMFRKIRDKALSCQQSDATHLEVEMRFGDTWKQVKSNVPSPYPMGCGRDF